MNVGRATGGKGRIGGIVSVEVTRPISPQARRNPAPFRRKEAVMASIRKVKKRAQRRMCSEAVFAVASAQGEQKDLTVFGQGRSLTVRLSRSWAQCLAELLTR